jgi:hypothetical protein
MRALSRTVATAAAIVLCREAAAQEASPADTQPPSTGVDILASGSALTAIGVLSFAAAPICKTSVIIPQEQSSCFEVSFVVGAPFLAAGVPLIVVGAVRHAKYAAWVRSHPAVFGLSFSPTAGGAALGWRGTF